MYSTESQTNTQDQPVPTLHWPRKNSCEGVFSLRLELRLEDRLELWSVCSSRFSEELGLSISDNPGEPRVAKASSGSPTASLDEAVAA